MLSCAPAARAAAVEAALDEFLEGIAGQDLGEQVACLPDGPESAQDRRHDEEDEGHDDVEAEVAQAVRAMHRSVIISVRLCMSLLTIAKHL